VGFPVASPVIQRTMGVILVGPSLFGLAERAPSRVPGLEADEYIRQSIVDPDAFVVPGFNAGQMVGDWTQVLSGGQIDSLVELLLSRWPTDVVQDATRVVRLARRYDEHGSLNVPPTIGVEYKTS
jgi:hypothetical protein